MSLITGPAPQRRSIIPWLFPGGLALVFAVNMIMLWIALGTFPGMVTRNAYEEGRRHNDVLHLDAAVAALGWQVAIRFLPQDGGIIEARYADRYGKPLRGLALQATLSRPVGDPARLQVPLHEGVPGTYRARLALPHRGLWDVHVVAAGGTGPHQKAERIVVP
jgi:nitrogen fixation protein FixH